MKASVLRLIFSLPLVCMAPTVSAQVTPDAKVVVPDVWDSTPTSSPDAPDFAARCTGIPNAELQKVINDVGSDSTATRRSADKLKPYLVVNQKHVICVKPSSRGYPILPVAAFRETIHFEGMDPEQAKLLWTSIATQLALHGTATALVKHKSGSAYQVTYLFASDTPYRMFYQVSHFMAGEYNESAYQTVVLGSDSMARTARGKPVENYKFLY